MSRQVQVHGASASAAAAHHEEGPEEECLHLRGQQAQQQAPDAAAQHQAVQAEDGLHGGGHVGYAGCHVLLNALRGEGNPAGVTSQPSKAHFCDHADQAEPLWGGLRVFQW